jgi:hypothetical protein
MSVTSLHVVTSRAHNTVTAQSLHIQTQLFVLQQHTFSEHLRFEGFHGGRNQYNTFGDVRTCNVYMDTNYSQHPVVYIVNITSIKSKTTILLQKQ